MRHRQVDRDVVGCVAEALHGNQTILAIMVAQVLNGVHGYVLDRVHSAVTRDRVRVPLTRAVGARRLAHAAALAVLALVHAAARAAHEGVHSSSRLARGRQRWVPDVRPVRRHFLPVADLVVLGAGDVDVRGRHRSHSLTRQPLGLQHHWHVLV